jgi:ketosteroid isomerase-like protein
MPAIGIGATAEQILLLERTALNRWGRGEPAGYSDIYADDVTYFDPLVAARIDGRDAMITYYKPWTGQIHVPRYELLRPRVDVWGDMALLTYNLVNYVQHADGTEHEGSCWNCTEVYVLREGGWHILHSHWSFTAHSAFHNMTPAQSEAG